MIGIDVRRLATGVVAAVIASTVAACGSGSGSNVVVSAAVAGNLHVEPGGTAPVTAGVDNAVIFERRATVTSVDVVEGAQVHQGQTLLTVYTNGDTGVIGTATNKLRDDQLQLDSVRTRDGAGAATTLALLAQVDRDRQALTDLKSMPTTITAPADGRVSGLSVQVGSQLTRTDIVLHVIDDRKLRVTVPVPSTYSSLITPGQNGQLTLPGGSGQSFPSNVVSIGPAVNGPPTHRPSAQVDTVPVTVELPNPDPAIPLGSAAYVRFPVDREAAVVVNSVAVLGADQQPFVFVAQNGRVLQRAVVTGVSDGISTEILSGLSVGEDVVISGGQQLISGDPVSTSRSDSA
jgi:membrane fusion protein (multidrug efflux system)